MKGTKTLTKAKIVKISKMSWQEINEFIFDYLTGTGDSNANESSNGRGFIGLAFGVYGLFWS